VPLRRKRTGSVNRQVDSLDHQEWRPAARHRGRSRVVRSTRRGEPRVRDRRGRWRPRGV